jgi:aconitate hydratase
VGRGLGRRGGFSLGARARSDDGSVKELQAIARLDTLDDVEYYRHGGLLPYVLRGMLA